MTNLTPPRQRPLSAFAPEDRELIARHRAAIDAWHASQLRCAQVAVHSLLRLTTLHLADAADAVREDGGQS